MHPKESDQPTIGKHRACTGNVSASRSTFDDQARLLNEAHHQLGVAYAAMMAAGVASETVQIPFLVAKLALTNLEQAGAQHERFSPTRYTDTVNEHLLYDMPGLDLCPDPATAETPVDFVHIMQQYRIWAGKPSYRVMERQCERRFAASTIHTALHGKGLPSLDMVHAIIKGCRGSEAHLASFTRAWRRIEMLHPASSRPKGTPALRAV